jgi:hypothetical protein
MNDGEMIPVYAPYPPDNHDPYLIPKRNRWQESDFYELPWPLEALLGTIWCNVHTGGRSFVNKISTDRWGKLVPFTEEDEEFSTLGVWWNDRFYMVNSVRVDHLPASGQLAWFCYEIDYLRRQIRQERTREERAIEEGIRSSSTFPFTRLVGPTPSYDYFRKMTEELEIATWQARTFALEHDLPTPSGLLAVHTFSRRSVAAPNEENTEIQSVRLSLSDLYRYTFSQLSSIIYEADTGIWLDVPYYTIGRTNNPLDIAYDYLKVLFVGETLVVSCKETTVKEFWDDELHLHSIRFTLQPKDIIELAKALAFLTHGFIDPHEYLKSQARLYVLPEDWLPHDFFEETPESEKFHKAVADFEEELDERLLQFPELADSYLGNYIHGCEPEGIKLDTTAHPEYKHMFWRSFLSRRVGFNFYVSSESWILPLEADIENLLVEHGGFRQGVPVLYEAISLTMGNLKPVVFNKDCVRGYPLEELVRAQRCAEEIFSDRLNINFEGRPLNIISQVVLDADGELLVASDQIAQYIFFRDCLPKVSPQVMRIILDRLPILSSLIGEQSNISCPWSELDDNQFEELCYDVVLSHYHPTRIGKMGKSRSRDGGRDIVFEMPERLGKISTKWIVQCKLIRDGRSLTSKKVEVSDTIDQYGAGGFCVMTSGLIDATLYDKLEGIKRTRSIQTDAWSRLELERFLVRHPEIIHRYFPTLFTEDKKL